MKNNILKSIFVSLLLIVGASNAWAVDHTGGYIYFLKPSTWTESKVMMFIGHDSYTSVYEMTKVANTDNLYRYTMPSWGGANYVAFANAGSVWGSGNWGSSNRTNAPHYTNVYKNYGFNSGSYYVIVPSGTENNASITINYKSSAANLNITTKAVASNKAHGTVSVSGYYMSNSTTAAARSAVSSTASNATASTTLAPGSTATFKATANTGYEFVGWYDAASGGNQLSTNTTYTVKYDISFSEKTVYGRFKAKQYTITYKDQGNASFSGTHTSGYPTTHTYGTATTLKTASKDGYTFGGWFTTSNCSGTAVTSLGATAYTANITLYAKWTLNTYAVNFGVHSSGNGTLTATAASASISSGANVNRGSKVVFTAAPNPGYQIEGWYSDAACNTSLNNETNNSYTIASLTAAATVYVKFEQLPATAHNITYTAQGTGWTYDANNPTSANEGERVSFTVTPSTGYTVKVTSDVNLEQDGNTYTFEMPAKDVAIAVTAEENLATVTILANNERGGTLKVDGNAVAYGSTVQVGIATTKQVTIEANNGYGIEAFKCEENAWIQDNGDGTYTLSAPGNGKTGNLIANFSLNEYTITYNLDGSTNHANNPGTYTVESGEITLQTPTKTGYTFEGWFTEAGFTNKVTQIAAGSTGNKTFYAKWTENKSTVVVTTATTNYGTLKFGSTAKDWGTIASVGVTTAQEITATANLGYRFVRWDLDGSVTSSSTLTEATITLKGDGTSNAGTATAVFEQLPPKTIYLKPSTGWKDHKARFAVYCWNSAGDTWIDMNAVDANNEYYTADIPAAYYTGEGIGAKFVRINPDFAENRWNTSPEEDPKPVWGQTHDINIPTDDNVLYDMTVNTHLYLKVSSEWKTDNARFAAYFFVKDGGNEKTKWMSMLDLGDDLFYCQIPTDYKFNYVIFCRMKPDDLWNSWDQKWSQTADLQIPTNGNNLFTINGWDSGSTWSKREDDTYDNSKWTTFSYSPYNVGDLRLVYIDDVNGAHPGHPIAQQAEGTKKDIVSFFVHDQGDARILLQRCTNVNGTEPTWETIEENFVYSTSSSNPDGAMLPGKRQSGIYMGAGCGVETSGVYNFVLEQTDGEPTLLTNETHAYEGDFYIRTTVSDGGWHNFRQESNKMTYSSYAEHNTSYTHYFCKWIKQNRSVKYVIANDYSYCISDTLAGDSWIYKNGTVEGHLPEDGNVRFTWDSRSNQLSRAYLRGSGNVSDRFLVLIGNEHLKDAEGNALPEGGTGREGLHANEAIFKDLNNWIYQVDVTANSQTTIQLSAKYNDLDQFFYGRSMDGNSRSAVINSNSNQDYKVRMIYDFKINNLLAAWVMNQTDTINTSTISSNMLIVRKDQEDANQINFNIGEAESVSVNTAYAVMTFTKNWVNDTTLTKQQRSDYWVSFPFDVKISDIFGFGEYGDQWIMLLYDGAERAEKGNWKDSPSFWKYITNRDYTLKAGVGYVLKLNLNKMTEANTYKHGATEASLYFPSTPIDGHTIINKEPTSVVVPEHICTINRDTPKGDRRILDSNWNLIGVPGFANLADLNVEYPAASKKVTINNDAHNLSFYYAYDATTNSYNAEMAQETFKNMHAYMVQFAGTIDWTNDPLFNIPAGLAARRNSAAEDTKVELCLELAQGEVKADQTFIHLQEEGATADFDMNVDMTKIINTGANIYTLVGSQCIQTAGNVLPLTKTIIPVGVEIATAGEYTFRMPEGTDNTITELIDYETNTRTNLLFSDYTVSLPAGTNEARFAISVRPEKVATSIENTTTPSDSHVRKFIIDGQLYLQAEDQLFDAQGKLIR